MNKYKTIIISDIHIGSIHSKVKYVNKFLNNNSCDLLILNGDIIDGWKIKKIKQLKKHDFNFFKTILKIIKKNNTKVIYIRGNHDDFLDDIIPFEMENISILKDYILESDINYYITHGDIFDKFSNNFIGKIGSLLYDVLLFLNTYYNNWRKYNNQKYYSISKIIKLKIKNVVSFISDFENKMINTAKQNNCQGIICGHIHQPNIKIINDIIYMNSGDWVENSSTLIETHDNQWFIHYYEY